jgi:hypothetical protein
MENERQVEKKPAQPKKISELFSLLKKKQNITLRDDQYDFLTLFDAVRQFCDRRYRFRLIDTGRFDPFELEWLCGYGTDLYTSDDVRSSEHGLELASVAARKGNAVVVLLINGKLEEEGENILSFSELVNVGRSGVYLHLTNRQEERDIQQVSRLAYSCAMGGSWMVYYHHGPLNAALLELGRSGAWIHITDQSLDGEENPSLIRDIILGARSAGSNLVLHWNDGNKFSLLDDIVNAGAVVLFSAPLFDYRSPMSSLEKGIRRKRLDFRAYYLHPSVLP